MRAWLLLVVSLVVVIAACSSDERSVALPAPPPATSSSPRVKPPVDLAPTHAPRIGFVAANGALFTEGSTFESKVKRDGAFEIVPRTNAPGAGPWRSARGTALSLSTIGIQRGARAIDIRGDAFIDADGAVAVRRGTVLERIENEGTGVEQSWRFDRAPAGDGDLVVRVAASGERFRTSTDHGLHFDGDELGVRYGTGTWVDATGARTTIVPRYADGAISLVVPSDVIERSTFPAVLDPTIGAEREVDMPAAVSPAPGEQSFPAIASLGAGQGYFTVWHDRRSVRPAFVGTRIASNGAVSDSTGVTILSGVSTNVQQPSLYASSTGLFLLWSVSTFDQWQDPGIYALRLDGTGKALDAAPIAVVKNTPNVGAATAAFDGANWLVSWTRYSQAAQAYESLGVRVDAGGAVLDTTPVTISSSKDFGYSPLLAFDGTAYFMTSLGTSGIYGQSIGKDLKPIGAATLLVSTSYVYEYATGFDGTRHLVTWFGYNGGYALSARMFDKQGQPLNGGAQNTLPTGGAYVNRPRVTVAGGNFLVTWAYGGVGIQGARISPASAAVDATAQNLFSTTSYIYDYGFASDDPASGVLVYRDYNATGTSGSDVGGVKIAVGAGLTGGAPFVVSAASNSETDASTAWNGTTYFAVWLDTRDKQPTIWGAPIAADGTPGTAVKLFANPYGAITFSTMSPPRIATNGQTFFITFAANQTGCATTCLYRSVFGFVVDATGAVQGKVNDLLPSSGATTNANTPDVAWSGSDYLVVYEETSDGSGIAGRRVKPDGTLLEDKSLRISPVTPGFNENRRAPSIAFDGNRYFVAWQTSRPTANGIPVSHIFGSRVEKEGSAVDGELAICNAFLLQSSPHVAADPKNGFFVVWDDYRTSLDSADIYGARVSPQGQLLDGDKGTPITTGEADESRATVTRSIDGTGWIVAWRDLRSKQSYDVYGAWVSAAGMNRDPKGYLFSAEGGDEETPSLMSGPPGALLLTYSRLDPRTGFGSYRMRARSIATGKEVAQACANSDECASRTCIDGFCCSTDCDGCGTCSATPGTCTPRAAGSESPRCTYRCKGTLDCPTECSENTDCASGATCDKASKKCVTRQICIDQKTLQDVTGKQTDCAPYNCVGDACRTSCGSVDDCAQGFVCDQAGRCVPPPNAGDVAACAVSVPGSDRTGRGVDFAAAIGLALAIASRRRRATR